MLQLQLPMLGSPTACHDASPFRSTSRSMNGVADDLRRMTMMICDDDDDVDDGWMDVCMDEWMNRWMGGQW